MGGGRGSEGGKEEASKGGKEMKTRRAARRGSGSRVKNEGGAQARARNLQCDAGREDIHPA